MRIPHFLTFFIDFLFPQKQTVLKLQSLTPSDLLHILPQAETISDNTIALFDYKDSLVRELVWELKYAGNRQIAEKLAVILSDTMEAELSERALFGKFDKPLLVPVPISDKRRNERGWNQAEILAEEIMRIENSKKGEKLFKYLPRQLVKHLHTESQTHTAGRRERLQNLQGSMRVLHTPSVEGKCVILLDDVTTTGATFSEAKRALKEAGAKKIICMAVAH